MSVILIPIPSTDFDPTETAIPWQVLKEEGHRVIFATPDGRPGQADRRMLDGSGLGPLAKILVADRRAQEAYLKMSQSSAFQGPMKWQECRAPEFNAILLPGGHAPGVKEFLESEILQGLITSFFEVEKPVAAICHGALLVARSKNRKNQRSVLFGKKTTSLPKWMELSAWGLTCLWLGSYYRTYPKTVQDEIKEYLANEEDFRVGPLSFTRDSPKHLESGFVIQDGNYISARWPGDAHRFAHTLSKTLKK